MGKGHDTAVDYWSLGVLLFELCSGIGPFALDADAPPIDIYRRILECHITYPPHFSRSLQDLTKKLLEPAAFKRLGNTATGAEGIKSHRWFEGYKWEDLQLRKIVPPVVPVVKSKLDASNFEDVPEVPLNELPPESDWNPDF